MNETQVASDEIQQSIRDLLPDLFSSLKKFKVHDKSGCNKLLKVFLLLFQKFYNLEKFVIKSDDNFINVLLDECLPCMTLLNELFIESLTLNELARIEIINRYAKNLKRLQFG